MERERLGGKSGEDGAGVAAYFDEDGELLEWIDEPPVPERSGVGWRQMMSHWDALVADFQEVYGISLTPEFLRSVTWPWFTRRAIGLLTRPPIHMQQDLGRKTRIVDIPTTRLGYAIRPPNFNPERT